MLKFIAVFLTVLVSTSMGQMKNNRIRSPMVRHEYFAPEYKFKMNPQNKRGDIRMSYRTPSTMQYNWHKTNYNDFGGSNVRKNYYQNNRKQDFVVGNRVRNRVRSTTPRSRNKLRPLAIFN